MYPLTSKLVLSKVLVITVFFAQWNSHAKVFREDFVKQLKVNDDIFISSVCIYNCNSVYANII